VIASGDTAPAAVLPFSVYLDGNLRLDRLAGWFQQRYQGKAYFLYSSGGHVYSAYPIGTPVALLPFYAPLIFFRDSLLHWRTEHLILFARVLEKVAASLITALSTALFFVLARQYLNRPKAILAAIVFGFATETWSISSQALWQHSASELTIVVSLLFLSRHLVEPDKWSNICGAALFAALSVAMRPSNVIFLLVCICAAIIYRLGWRFLAAYSCFGVLIGTAVALYNWKVFGNLRGIYVNGFDGSAFSGLTGLLFSPGRGLFVYTPVFLLLVPGTYLWIKHRSVLPAPMVFICAAFALLHVALYSRWGAWWGGHCFGPRLLTDIVPCLSVLMFPVIALISQSQPLRIAFIGLLTCSLVVQFAGAFCYPQGYWDAVPRSVDVAPSRLWNWADNPISRTAGTGINVVGYKFLYELIVSFREKRAPDLKQIKIGYVPPTRSLRASAARIRAN
jgi:hypothetical protein